MLKKNRLLHFFTNSIAFGNITWLSGRGNVFSGRLKVLRFRSKIIIKGQNNHITVNDGIISRTKIYIKGNSNTLTIENDCSINNTIIWISGNNNKIILGKRIHINNADLGAEHTGSVMILKDGAQIGGFKTLGFSRNKTQLSRVYASEGKCIDIGEECAISDGVTIRNSDSHPIFDENGTRINEPKDVSIGNGVWICSGASLFKGAGIGVGSVLGGDSILTKDYSDLPNVLLAGSPAKPIKENIRWSFD